MRALVLGIPWGLGGLSVLCLYLYCRVEKAKAERGRGAPVEPGLAKELPFFSFLDEAGMGLSVSVDSICTSYLALSGIDTDCLDDEALEAVSATLHSLLLGLPIGARLELHHFTDGQVEADLASYEKTAGQSELGRVFAFGKTAHLRACRTLRKSHLLAAVSAPSPGRRGLGPVPKRIPPSLADHEADVRKLAGLTNQVRRGLEAAGVRVQPLSAAEIQTVLYELLNPGRGTGSGFVPGLAPSDLCLSAREALVFTGLEEKKTELGLGSRRIRVLTLKGLPDVTEPAILERLLLGLSFPVRASLSVQALDAFAEMEKLKSRRNQAHLLATMSERRNQDAEAQEDDVAELIDENLRSQVRMVRVSLAVVLSVAEGLGAEALLEKRTTEVIRTAQNLHGLGLMTDEYRQMGEFLASLPGNGGASLRSRKMTSQNAAHLLPVWEPFAGSRAPALLLENGRGHLVGLDPFDDALDNPNAFMAGASGAGKSVTANFLLLNVLSSGAKALVIDRGGSYRRLFDLVGGAYFDISPEHDVALNPFFPAEDLFTAEGAFEERRLAFLLAVLERMVLDPARPELRHVERAILTEAVRRTYAGAGTETPILSDLGRVLATFEAEDAEDRAIARALGRDLRVWTEGPAARLINRPSTIALGADCAAFDLKGLEEQPHLQAVVMLILGGMIWNLVLRDPTERKMVVFDEVWRLLESPASARLVAELYRTSRKYRCSILTISQSVEDFTGSPIASALVGNSATVYLLRHRRGHEVLAREFRLNAQELEVFRSLEMRRGEYSEVLVLHGSHHFLGRVVLSPLEYWIATTHPADLARERQVAEAHPDLSRLGVLRLLAEEHPKGAAAEVEVAKGAA
jgi:conjugal transfer ATP-binding protein TraC